MRGLSRGVKRVGSQQEAARERRLVGEKHGGLTAAVGLASKEKPPRDLRPQKVECGFEAFAVTSRVAGPRWAGAAIMTKR